MYHEYFKRIMSTIILLVLIVLSFFLIKPILLSIIFGVILAFIFNPIYKWFFKKTKSKNFSASLTCFVFLLLIVIPFWFLVPVILSQAFKIYLASQQIDFVPALKSVFSFFFPSEELSNEVGSILYSAVGKLTNSVVNSLSQLILRFPEILLHSFVVIFTIFFSLRDKDEFIGYMKSFSPFPKEVEKKILESSRGIASSVIYGQVVVGFLQGIIAGIGFVIFGVPNAIFLTLLAIFAGIFPVLGPFVIWVPVLVYLLISGNTFAAIGVLIFGTVASTIDNILRPIIISKRTNIPASILLVGTIGGVYLFGVLGIILGPLIFAYLIIVLELYRNKNQPEILQKEP